MSTDNKPLDINKVIVNDNNDPYHEQSGTVIAKVKHGRATDFIVQFLNPSDWSYFKRHQIKKATTKEER